MTELNIPIQQKIAIGEFNNALPIVVNVSKNWITLYKNEGEGIALRPGARLESLLSFTGVLYAIGSCEGFDIPTKPSTILVFTPNEFIEYSSKNNIQG